MSDLLNIWAAARQADQLALAARDMSDGPARKFAALQALERSALSVNAWCLLGSLEDAGSPEQLDLYRRAVSAAITLTGISPGADYDGLEQPEWTDPLITALLAMAEAFGQADNLSERIECLSEVVRLDPADKYQARHRLAQTLLNAGHLVRLRHLFAKYRTDRSAVWLWTRALVAFKLEGETEESNEALDEALNANIYIAPYLLGRLTGPASPSSCELDGEAKDALTYIALFAAHWEARPLAKAWVSHRAGYSEAVR